MSKIGTLLAGAGVTTPIVGQKKCDQFLLIGDVDTANPLSGLVVEVGGVAKINIADAQTLVTAFAKWTQELCGATVGMLFKLATGVINESTTYRLTNAGATTPDIFAYSEAPKGANIEVATDTLNASSSQSYQRFSALFIQTPANVSSIEIQFSNGHRDTFAMVEIDARFSLYNQAEANGQLGGVSIIDNTDQSITAVRINTNAVGALTVLIAKLPDSYFNALKKAL